MPPNRSVVCLGEDLLHGHVFLVFKHVDLAIYLLVMSEAFRFMRPLQVKWVNGRDSAWSDKISHKAIVYDLNPFPTEGKMT